MNKYATYEQLVEAIDGMNMAALRELSRDFGIIPRNRRRSELISLIVSSYRGQLQPEEPKKPGRPTRSSTFGVSAPAPQIVDDVSPSESPDNVDKSLPRCGILEIMPDGYGFVRTSNFSTTPSRDYYLSANVITHMNLHSGDKLKVLLHQYPDRVAPTAIFIQEINDQVCNTIRRVPFDSLEACFPNERIRLDGDKRDYSLRALDLVAPIGKGQRGLIVAPPKTGKTILLKKIAMAVRRNHPEIHLTVLLIDERPEEVTDFKESVDCEVVYSTFDQAPQNHTRVAELVFANARRRVEQGQDVMILLDSITRLGRAYNQTAEQSGRTLTGGLDIAALQEPKKMFGAGRNVRGGGSLTILATALIDTGSRMDDIIYEEFKGTGNMEIQLDRKMSERRIFPAIDLNRSSTRREDLLLSQDQLEGAYIIRRMLSREDPVQATEELLEIIMTTDDNDEAVDTLKRLMRSAAAHRIKK
ncbi:MAG: transcription termination factor Rho [Corallococcus sp.]|nr:transcription termination factor Rho [Corallococcus sp.]MCM1359412.1 transcription termination factor Rho [Corallococcus sp.]MCM1394855.1 transcription termination factor Rho [Corallococcus sp.]